MRTTDWISQDAQTLKLRWTLWDPIAFFSFFVVLLLLWILPFFLLGFAFRKLQWLTYAVPVAAALFLLAVRFKFICA